MRIELVGLTKVHPGGVTALSGVDLTIERGLQGLLGPNGAGKSTLMKITCTLLAQTSGSIRVDGVDLETDRDARRGLRERLGYLGQEWGAPRSARCWEVLDLVLALRGVEKSRRPAEIARLLDVVGLTSARDRKVKQLSGGMLRRLGVAQALAGDPELIVMDEPTVGLDPDERVHFRNMLTSLGQERTILLSTHIVADVGNTCSRVSVLAKGKILFDGAPGDLAALARGHVWEVEAGREREERIRLESTVASAVPLANGARLRVVGARPGPDAEEVEPTLEDAYLLLVPDASADAGGAIA